MRFLLRLYPRAWRAKYEVEVARMLDDSSSGPGDAPDLIRGAIDAHAHPEPLGLPARGVRASFTLDHIAGMSALVAGILWAAPYLTLMLAVALTSYPAMANTQWVALTAVSMPLVVLAMVGLLAGHVRDRRTRFLAAAAMFLTVVGTARMITTLLDNLMQPDTPLVTTGRDGVLATSTALVLVGTYVAVVAMWGHVRVSRRPLMLLALSCLLFLAFLAVNWDIGLVMTVTSVAGSATGMLVGVAWIGVGWSAIRGEKVSSDPHLHSDALVV